MILNFLNFDMYRHPLHLACLCHCPSTIASTVLNAYPEAAAIADSAEEQYPLHIAALHGANGTLLQRLYNCYPDAIKARTKTHGWLPLHLACHKDATPGAVRILLEYYPEAAQVRIHDVCILLLIAASNANRPYTNSNCSRLEARCVDPSRCTLPVGMGVTVKF